MVFNNGILNFVRITGSKLGPLTAAVNCERVGAAAHACIQYACFHSELGSLCDTYPTFRLQAKCRISVTKRTGWCPIGLLYLGILLRIATPSTAPNSSPSAFHTRSQVIHASLSKIPSNPRQPEYHATPAASQQDERPSTQQKCVACAPERKRSVA